MRFVMTGYKGLIGNSLLKRLIELGHEAVLLVDKRDGKNILDINSFELSEPADMMIHLASFCKINKTIEDPSLPFENNVKGTHEVLEFCRKNKIPKIVFTSSSRVLEPEKNVYTESKRYGETLCEAYKQCYGLEYVIVRPSTVYGGFNDLSERLIDIFMLNALQGKDLKIYGDENKTLDFTYVDDFVDGIMLAMKESNKEFDISTGQSTKVSCVADMILDLAGQGKKVFYPAEKAQPQEVNLDISAIKNLGYDPKISIEEGIERTFEWYEKNFEEILKSRKLL